MAKISNSFLLFQQLLGEATITEPGSGLGADDNKEKSLKYFCDNVLSTMHGIPELRDAIVDSRANFANDSVLLMINQEFKDFELLLNTIRSLESVDQIAVGKREYNGETIRAIKLKSKTVFNQ